MSCEYPTTSQQVVYKGESHVLTDEALSLYEAGMNVFPIVRGEERPFGNCSVLYTTRLLHQDIVSLMQDSDLAVMTGRTSGNLFVLDCTTSKDFEEVGHKFRKLGVCPWIRNGIHGGQYWLRCLTGTVRNTKAGLIEVLGTNKYAVAPPSIHPTGMVYEWQHRSAEIPGITEIQLRELCLGLERDSISVASQLGLTEKAVNVLVGHDASGYQSSKEAEYATCLSLIGIGKSDEEIMGLFSDYNPPYYNRIGAETFQGNVLRKARKNHKPLDKVLINCGSQDGADPSYFRRQANRPWHGRTGALDCNVYLALCKRFEMDGQQPFRASYREVAQLAAVTPLTAQRSISRLTKAKDIALEGRDSISKSNLYRLLICTAPAVEGIICENDPLSLDDPCKRSVLGLNTSDDIWTTAGLGKSALLCYSVLLQDATPAGLKVSDLVRRTGKYRATVTKALNKLLIHALVEQHNGQWRSVVADEEYFTRIANLLGISGIGARRAQQYNMERQKRAGQILVRDKQRHHRQLRIVFY